MVEAAEGGQRSLPELIAIQACLTAEDSRATFERYGPTFCPEAPRLRPDLDFRVLRISDCAIISAEVSPSGVMAIIAHCWSAVFNLMRKGILCRGYITQGNVYHTDSDILGTGYMQAYKKERDVTAFRKDLDETGTPFVELDPLVTNYLAADANDCVRMMAGRMIRREGETTVVFPFDRLTHEFVLGPNLDPQKERRSVAILRKLIATIREQVITNSDPNDEKNLRKTQHYLDALKVQDDICIKMDGDLTATKPGSYWLSQS